MEWNTINWRKIQKAVFKMQKRIYRAYASGDEKKGRRLQKTLINSYYNRLLAVKKVTQDNPPLSPLVGGMKGGVDKVKSLTPKQRLQLAKDLTLGDKSQPIRRVWIPKPPSVPHPLNSPCKGERSVSPFRRDIERWGDERGVRPLGIPVMRDRAVQALAKAALEPEWEAKFESNSYGFRPGRSAHDAIEAIFNQVKQKSKYVLDADISKCFDRINHQKLLTKLNTFPKLRKQIRAWLKADICDFTKHERTPNQQGTSQGGVISPLLSNIALHGMETRIKQVKGASLVRYADDFVIFHENLEVLKQCQKIICEWLTQFDLELKPSKTKLVHTLNELNGNKPGFDFLGFNIRQYKVGKHQSSKNQHGKILGFKTIIKPSDDSVKKHYNKLSETIKRFNAAPQTKLIKELNPIIRGWCNYFKTVCSKETFSKVSSLTYLRLRTWADRRHPNKGKNWVSDKYWKTVGNDNWVFATQYKGNDHKLIKHTQTAIIRHVKVKGSSSPFDGDTLYWGKRMSKHPELKTQVTKLLNKQDGKCNWCNLPFSEGDIIETDHITPRGAGGNSKKDNLQLLHRHCHDIKTKSDLRVIKRYKAEKEWSKTQKQFKLLNWDWVDDIPTLLNGLGIHKEPDNRGAQ
ncbi:MAG: group II intron reverse transcriptase/maturase [Xenococcaceae cyanobacterium MO_167.B27]|nr:group II intron reverse transcriptase/maturase [Xenococcaceae cyanobacterium MO_167.B27]